MFDQVRQGRSVRGWVRWSTLAFLALGCSAGAEEDRGEGRSTGLEARSEFEKISAPERPAVKSRLIAKFKDSLRMRAEPDGGFRSAANAAERSKASELEPLARQYRMRFSQHIRLPEASLQDLESQAAQASGRAQPDLAGVLAVDVPEESLEETAEALQASPLTEYVYFEQVDPPPPQQGCSDQSPDTPNFTPLQAQHGPEGLNLTAAWELTSDGGAGVWVADCEYSYNPNHEDLCGIIPGLAPISHGDDDFTHHGTAALGELVGGDNSYGCTGVSPAATAYFFSEQNGRRVTAITEAVKAMRPGDVVLLEMQVSGSQTEERYAPAEIELAVWDAVKVGTDKGVIVVAAAGNGFKNGRGPGEDLDSANYAGYRARGDSGAIIVGAGAANARHDKLFYSTFGSRVDVQGWGERIITTGYGGFARLGGDVNQAYTDSFGGTSGASAMVAGAVVWLQGVADTYLGRRLRPLEMRKLLINTGTPQGSGEHIGPIPNVEAAARAIMDGNPCGDGTCAP